ncbi:MAG TPA: hypothetical protein VI112_05310 [Bacteroidia bacterium]|jgi:hypothetical protein
MKIVINDHRKIFAVQEEFSALFPYLKIIFHARPGKKGAAPSKKIVSTSSKTLGECRLQHNKGTVTVSPEMTVADLEQHFSDIFGLYASIYRQSGKAWLETSATDSWTLAQQNQMGEELSKGKNVEE